MQDDGAMLALLGDSVLQVSLLEQAQDLANGKALEDNEWDRSLPNAYDSFVNAQIGLIEAKIGARKRCSSSNSIADSESGVADLLSDASLLANNDRHDKVVDYGVTEEQTARLASIYAYLVLANLVAIRRAACLMCRMMTVSYVCPEPPVGSQMFPAKKFVVLFVRTLIDSLQVLVKSFGGDFLSEVIRFSDSCPEGGAWKLVDELRAISDPWESGGGDLLPHYGSSGINSVEQLEDATASLGGGAKGESASKNERKDYFDGFNNLVRRFSEAQGSGEGDVDYLKWEFPTAVREICGIQAKHYPWLAQLFLKHFLEIVQEAHHAASTSPSSAAKPVKSPLPVGQLGIEQTVGSEKFNRLQQRIEPATAPQTSTPNAFKLTPSHSNSGHKPKTYSSGRGRSSQGFTSSFMSGSKGHGKVVEREDMAPVKAHLATLFGVRALHFFPLFLFEANNARFNAHCASAILSTIQTLSQSQSGGDGLHIPDLNGGRLSSVLSQLRHLGCLLGFLHFHHLPLLAVMQSSPEEIAVPLSAQLPLVLILDDACRLGRVGWTVTWVAAYLQALGAYSQTSPFLGQGDALARLRAIEVAFLRESLRLGSLSPNRLAVLIEIQGLWSTFPAALTHIDNFSASGVQTDAKKAGEQWTLRLSLLRHLSTDLHKALLALRDAKPTAAPVAVLARKRVSTTFMALPQASSGLSFNLAAPSLGMATNTAWGASVGAGVMSGALLPSIASSFSSSGFVPSPEPRRSVPRSPSTNCPSSAGKKKATLGALSSPSPVSERQRAPSTSSHTSAVERRKGGGGKSGGLTPRALFTDLPDGASKVVMDRLEKSFWAQHDHLQRVHAFAFSHCFAACVYRIKEFIALSLRRVNAEVDAQASNWLPSIAAFAGDNLEKAVADGWTAYHSKQLVREGCEMIQIFYAEARTRLVGLYLHFPDAERVVKLAVHYTATQLRVQEAKLVLDLRVYSERKLRELQDKKKKVLLAMAERAQGSEVESTVAGVMTAVNSTTSAVSPSSPAQFRLVGEVEEQTLRQTLDGVIAVLLAQHCISPSTSAVETGAYAWSLLDSDGLPRPALGLRLALVLECAQRLLGQLPVLLRCQRDPLRLPWERPHAEDSVPPGFSFAARLGATEASWAKEVLANLRHLFASLPSALAEMLAPTSTPFSDEQLGQAKIEIVLFLTSALPFLLGLDLVQPPASSLLSTRPAVWAAPMVAAEVVVGLVQARLLSIESLYRLVLALRRDKSVAFHEHSKNLPRATTLLSDGLTVVFARLVAATCDHQRGVYGSDVTWWPTGELAHRILSCECVEGLTAIMTEVVPGYSRRPAGCLV